MSNSELSGNLWVRDETGQILEIWQHRPGISSSLAHRSTPPPAPQVGCATLQGTGRETETLVPLCALPRWVLMWCLTRVWESVSPRRLPEGWAV